MDYSSPTQTLTIGRDPGNNIVLQHSNVSRYHAVVKIYSGGRITITDMASTNGTYVDGRRLPPHTETPIQYGSDVRISGAEILPWSQIMPQQNTRVGHATAMKPQYAGEHAQPQPAWNSPNHQPSYPPPQHYTPQAKLPNANAALVLGILSLIAFGIIFGLIAVILANGAIEKYRLNPRGYSTSSFNAAQAGMVLGTIGIVAWALILYFMY